MRLSVVIPTLNEQDRVVVCVESALALADGGLGGGGAAPVEVVVSDGGSDDATRRRAQSAGAAVIEGPAGRGGQLRRGVKHAVGDVVLMLHGDATIAPAAGRQLAAAMADDAVGCGAFRQRIDDPRRVYRWLEAGNAFRARRWRLPYGDQAIFARRALLDAVGGVPDQPLMEDVELMLRLRRVTRPVLLDGPVFVSARRWRERGVVRQTARNWSLLAAYRLGASPERLLRRYEPQRADCKTVDAAESSAEANV